MFVAKKTKTVTVNFGTYCNCKICSEKPNGTYFITDALKYQKNCDKILILGK